MFSINVARKKAAHHPLALKTEAEWDKNEFWGIFRASLVAMMPNVETAAPSRGSSDASMLSCCPKSSWPDGKAAVFLLCGQFRRPCWGSWVLAGGGAGEFWVTAQLLAIAGFASAAVSQFGSWDILATFPSRLAAISVFPNDPVRSLRCSCQTSHGNGLFLGQDLRWRRWLGSYLEKRGFGIHLSRTMAAF